NGSTYPTDFDDPDLRRAQGYLRSFGAEVAIDAHGVRVDISAIRDEVPVVDGRSLFRSRLEPHTVVLVDDNETVRSLVRRLLVRQGFRVLSAATGDEALRLCVAHRDRIDLLLTDIFLPDLGGRRITKQKRSVRPNLPVLYMSGYSRARIEGLSADDPFIAKPFTSDELFARVCALLS
ncbi:MAG: response regulator, partial [Planctomycetes bacterium]|nr:response regulator [Planctomycetota bacterium]